MADVDFVIFSCHPSALECPGRLGWEYGDGAVGVVRGMKLTLTITTVSIITLLSTGTYFRVRGHDFLRPVSPRFATVLQAYEEVRFPLHISLVLRSLLALDTALTNTTLHMHDRG